jgi:dihydroxy-acid dehydratase
MSGTAYGTVVLHVAPEAAAGGPLARVRSGDTIVLDVPARRLDVAAEDLDTRPPAFETAYRPPERGYGALFDREVLQADEGCDFAFLVPPRR